MDDEQYTSRQVEQIFDLSHETVRTWAEEFAEYLSTDANPGKGRPRRFSTEDMEVLALVAAMRTTGSRFEDIHASLKSGSRGDAPNLSPQEVTALATTTRERQLGLQIEVLQRTISDLTKRAEEGESAQRENIGLRKELEIKTELLQDAQALLEKMREENQRLSREAGEAHGRGMLEAMERLGKLGKDGRPDTP